MNMDEFDIKIKRKNFKFNLCKNTQNYFAQILKASVSKHQLNQARAIYKYNVSKKISQLNKVIQLFLSQIADRQYQIQQIKFYNDARIDNVFQNHFTTMASLNKTAFDFQLRTESDYSTQFQNEYQELNESYTQISLEIDRSIQNLISEVISLNNEVNVIDVDAISNNQELQDNFLKWHSNTFSFLQSKIKQMEKDLINEIDILETTSSEKISELQKKSNETMELLTHNYEQELTSLNSQKFVQIGLDATFLSSFQTFKQSFKQISSEIKLEYEKFKNINHLNIKELIDIYKTEFDQFRDEIKVLENDYNKLLDETSKEKENFEDLYKENQMNYEKELIKMQKELVDLIEKHNNEYLEKINEAKSSSLLSNSSLKELFEMLEKERNDLISKFETEDKIQAKNDLNSIIQMIKKEDDQFQLKIKEYQELLQRHKERHFSEKANILSEHQEDLDNEIDSFNKESQKIRQLIQSNSNNNNSMISNQAQILSQIKSEKVFIIQKHANSFTEFDNKKQKEFNQIKSEHSLEIERTIQIEKELLEKVINDNQSIITSNENEFQKQKMTLLQNNENKRCERLNSIRNESQLLYDDEISKLEQKYKEIYDEESQILVQIEPPSNSFNFSSLNNQLNDLSIEKANILRKISIERTEINENYEYEIQQEKLRHENYLDEMKNKGRKNNGRDTLRQTLRLKIAEIQQIKQTEGDRLTKLLKELQDIHTNSIEQFEKDVKYEKNLTEKEIKELNELLQKLMQESDDQIQQKNQICKSEVDIFTHELFEANNLLKSKKEELENSHQNLLNNFNSLFSSLNFQLFEINRNSSLNDKQQKEDLANLIKSIENNHKNQLDQLDDQIKQKKSMNVREMIENSDNIQSMTKLNNDKINSYKIEIEEMIKDLIKKKNTMISFYEEKFTIAAQLNEEWRNKYANRPPRDSEIDAIDKLENHCKILTGILKSALKDITNYRKLNAAKEKEYNAKFGRNPAVGVMYYYGSSNRNNNRYAY